MAADSILVRDGVAMGMILTTEGLGHPPFRECGTTGPVASGMTYTVGGEGPQSTRSAPERGPWRSRRRWCAREREPPSSRRVSYRAAGWAVCSFVMPWSGSLRAVDEDTYVRNWQMCLVIPLCGRKYPCKYRRTPGTNTFQWDGNNEANEVYEAQQSLCMHGAWRAARRRSGGCVPVFRNEKMTYRRNKHNPEPASSGLVLKTHNECQSGGAVRRRRSDQQNPHP